MADITNYQAVHATEGPQRLPYNRHAVVGSGDDPIVNRTLYRFLKAMAWIGGPAILAWFVWSGYFWGSRGCYTCTQNQPAAVTAPVTPKPQDKPVVDPVVAEQIKALTAAVEKLASTPASAATPVQSPETAAELKEIRSTLEKLTPRKPPVPPAPKPDPCPCPPRTQTREPEKEVGLTVAEQRQDDLWAPLNKRKR